MDITDTEQEDHRNRIMDQEQGINLQSDIAKKSQDRKQKEESRHGTFKTAHEYFVDIPYTTRLVYWGLIVVILCAYGFDVLLCRPTAEYFGLTANLSQQELQLAIWLIPAILIGIEMGMDGLVAFFGGSLEKVGKKRFFHWLFAIWSWFLVFALSSIFVATQLVMRNGLALHIFLLQVIPLAFFSSTTHLILIAGGHACRYARSYPFFLMADMRHQINVRRATRAAERDKQRLHEMLLTYFKETYQYFSRYGERIEASFTEQSVTFTNKFYGYTKIGGESPKAASGPSHTGTSSHGTTGTDWDPLGDKE